MGSNKKIYFILKGKLKFKNNKFITIMEKGKWYGH
jgi:hypothetical protein